MDKSNYIIYAEPGIKPSMFFANLNKNSNPIHHLFNSARIGIQLLLTRSNLHFLHVFPDWHFPRLFSVYLNEMFGRILRIFLHFAICQSRESFIF